MSRRGGGQPVPQSRGRVYAEPYADSVIIPGQESKRDDPPPYVNTAYTQEGASSEIGRNEYIELGLRPATHNYTTANNADKTRQEACGRKNCKRGCIIIVVIVICSVVAVAAAGGTFYVLRLQNQATGAKDECASLPCQNGATCVDFVNRYECRCKAGYQGTHCEQDTNECLSLPCQNGATCVDHVDRHECRCKEGYHGAHCEQDVNECASSPCRNEGTCDDLINGYECQCRQGYTGKRCEEDINECASNPCQNGGACNDVINGYSCQCPAEYIGQRCQQDKCPRFWHFYGGSCYRYFNMAKTWFDANTYCKNLGAELLSVHSYSENNFVNSLAGVEIWCGLNDLASEGRFVWSDGSPVSYTNWYPGEPNNKDNEDCGHFNYPSFGWWNDTPCSRTIHFICEM